MHILKEYLKCFNGCGDMIELIITIGFAIMYINYAYGKQEEEDTEFDNWDWREEKTHDKLK